MCLLGPNRPLISLAIQQQTLQQTHFLAIARSHHVSTLNAKLSFSSSLFQLYLLGSLYPTISSWGLYFDTSISRATVFAGQARHRLAVPASHASSRLVPITSIRTLTLSRSRYIIQHGSSAIRTRHRCQGSTAQFLRFAQHLVHRNDARDSIDSLSSLNGPWHSLSRLSSSSWTSTSQ